MQTNNSSEIVNRVSQSGLIVVDIAEFYPQGKRIELDIKDFLYQGLILKEKEFRSQLADLDKSSFQDAYVAVFCSEDTIIPVWAYMVVVKELSGIAKDIYVGTPEEMDTFLFNQALKQLDEDEYRDQKVVVKGCDNPVIKPSNYAAISQKLIPVVKSLMFGEPCSTVPIFKRKS